MKSRERVITALQHKEPDRVPLALGGGPYGIVDELYLKLVNLLNLQEPVPPFRAGHSISYMDDRLLEKLGTDTRYCWPNLLPNSPVIPGEDEDTFYDSYGQVWKRALPYYYTGKGLLEETNQIDDIERLIRWPDLSDPIWTAGVADRAQNLHENSDYFVILRMVASHGPFQTACDLRGTENFLMDMSLNPEYAQTLLDKITTIIEGLIKINMTNAGKYFDMVELPGDDYAGNSNTIISPRMFRRFIKPCLQRLVNAVKEDHPNVRVMLHSDGAISKLIEDMIDIGVDVLHPLEPLLATDIPLVKETFGERISFLGGIDISHAMPGSTQDVINEVKTRVAQLAADGGYIMAPSNHLQADIPPENVVTLFETAHKVAIYPLSDKLLK